MNAKDFEALVKFTQGETSDLLIAKGAEYANDADRLANFKRNAEKQGQTVLDVWKTYYGKHVDAVDSYMARVRKQAVKQALAEVIDTAIRLNEQGSHVRLDDIDLTERINRHLPSAMAWVNATLSEPIAGRFHDIINYCHLGLAILKELEGEKQ